MQSRARLGQLLVASAVLAPVSIGAYKWNTDPEFKQKVLNLKLRQPPPSPAPPPLAPMSPPPPVVVAVQAPAPVPVAAAPAAPVAEQVKINLKELAELEAKLLPALVPAAAAVLVVEEEEVKQEEEAKQQEEPAAAPAPPAAAPPAPTNFFTVDHRAALDQVRLSSTQLSATVAEETAKEIAQAQQRVREEIEIVLARDLSETNDPVKLKQRLVQLTLELQDRSKWEALRLHDAILATTQQLSQKFQALFRQQEAEYENIVKIEVASASADAVDKTDRKLRQQLEERLVHQRDQLKREMDALVLRARDEERLEADEERASRLQLLHGLMDQISQLSVQLSQAERAQTELRRRVHLLQLASKLQTTLLASAGGGGGDVLGKQVEEFVGQIRVASHGDGTVCSLVDQLPHRVFAAGVSSPSKLAAEFDQIDLQAAAVQAAGGPVAGVVQQGLDKMAKLLTIGGGGAGGPSVLAGVDDVQLDQLQRDVAELLHRDQVWDAVQRIESTPTLVHGVAQNEQAARWLDRAKDRLKVEATLRVLIAWLSGEDEGK